MAEIISGIYLNLEGTNTELNSVQFNRETSWSTEYEAYRYVDDSGVIHYVYEHPTLDQLDGVDVATATSGDLMIYNGTDWVTIDGTTLGIDEQVKATSGDATPGYLDAKIIAGSGMYITDNTTNIEIESSGVVGVAAGDVLGYLEDKLVAGEGIEVNNSGTYLEILSTGGGGEKFVELFNDGDLDENNSITITHGLGNIDVLVQVYDADNNMFLPTNITIVNVNNILLDFSMDIVQSFKVVVYSNEGFGESFSSDANKYSINDLGTISESGLILDYMNGDYQYGVLDINVFLKEPINMLVGNQITVEFIQETNGHNVTLNDSDDTYKKELVPVKTSSNHVVTIIRTSANEFGYRYTAGAEVFTSEGVI